MPEIVVLMLLALCVFAEIGLTLRIAGARQRGDATTIRRDTLLSMTILMVIVAHGIWVGDRFERVVLAAAGVAGIAALVQTFRRWPKSDSRRD